MAYAIAWEEKVMARFTFAILICLFFTGCGFAQSDRTRKHIREEQAQSAPRPARPVHTFSIVARDPATGDMGVAVQSHWFAVGAEVTWGEAGVGVVATQSFVDPGYGPRGLDLMRSGKTANETLRALLAGDQFPDVRQVAMVDSKGNVAVHTGSKCIAAAGHQAGKNYSAQANLMEKPTVWPAMGKAFEAA